MKANSQPVDDFLRKAQQLLGSRGFTTNPEDMAPWMTDWRGRYHGRALALASPASRDQLSGVLKLCWEHRVPVVPQGGNTGMCGGATPDETGTALLLSLRRMNAIRKLDCDARVAICEPGVILQDLHDAAASHGLRFPLTLGGKGSATIGGLISTNAGGTQVLRHGTMRAQVLGLEAVLSDGRVFEGLAALKKDNRGFDLKQLFIGSEGTLGVVSAATLRLLPAFAQRRVAFVGLARLADAYQLLRRLEGEIADALEGFEVLEDHCLTSVLGYLPGARSPIDASHPWYALIEIVAGAGQEDLFDRRLENVLSRALEDGLILDATIASNEKQAEDFWKLRDSIAPAEKAIGPAMQHDISVAVADMPAFVEQLSEQIEKEFPGTRAVAFGHLGDGNIHFHVLAPPNTERGKWETDVGKRISARVHEIVTQWGGSISAEHGIGQMKRDELARLGDPVALSMMRAVKHALDPRGILNPGKLLPLA